jgi:hypothetical protein
MMILRRAYYYYRTSFRIALGVALAFAYFEWRFLGVGHCFLNGPRFRRYLASLG